MRDGTLYLWTDRITHKDAYGYFNIPTGAHLFIEHSNNIIIYLTPGIDLDYLIEAFKNTTSLYNYVNKDAQIEEFNTTIYKTKKDDKFDEIKTINDLINYNEVDNA